jgi:hypothetical protein
MKFLQNSNHSSQSTTPQSTVITPLTPQNPDSPFAEISFPSRPEKNQTDLFTRLPAYQTPSSQEFITKTRTTVFPSSQVTDKRTSSLFIPVSKVLSTKYAFIPATPRTGNSVNSRITIGPGLSVILKEGLTLEDFETILKDHNIRSPHTTEIYGNSYYVEIDSDKAEDLRTQLVQSQPVVPAWVGKEIGGGKRIVTMVIEENHAVAMSVLSEFGCTLKTGMNPWTYFGPEVTESAAQKMADDLSKDPRVIVASMMRVGDVDIELFYKNRDIWYLTASPGKCKLPDKILVLIDPTYPRFQTQDPKYLHDEYLQFIAEGTLIPASELGPQGSVIGDVMLVDIELFPGIPTNIVDQYAYKVVSISEAYGYPLWAPTTFGYHHVYAFIPLNKMESLANLSEVRSVSMVYPPECA